MIYDYLVDTDVLVWYLRGDEKAYDLMHKLGEVSKSKAFSLKSNIVETYLIDGEKQFCSQHKALIENSILSYSEKQIVYGNGD